MIERIVRIALTASFFPTLLFNTDATAQRKQPGSRPKTLTAREIAAKVMPSVVIIITQDENGNPISQGSGFVFKPGLVVSNLHVFERATRAIVKNVKTGEVSNAIEVVAMNGRQDLCVIRIADSKSSPLPLGNSRVVETGDEIYVASNPKGLEGSFTKGIVSGIRERDRVQPNESDATKIAKEIWRTTDLTLFQIDAAISPGSSGGVVLNTRGEAIGIVKSSIVSGQNLNFSIPIEQLVALPQKFKHPVVLAGACAFSSVKQEGLVGPVKSVKESYASYDSLAERFGNTVLYEVQKFDRYGNETEVEQYSAGRLLRRLVIEYDENRLRRSVIQTERDNSSKKHEFGLEDAIENKLLSKGFSGSFGSLDDELGIVYYNRNGEQERLLYRVADERVQMELRYYYDSNSRLISSSLKNKNGMLFYRYSYTSDSVGNWTKQTQYVRSAEDEDWRTDEIRMREIVYYE
ncbi:MAG: serine protease [Acidobacteria bacterium]|nr:serine protease [Acidobacteriota bacterium]